MKASRRPAATFLRPRERFYAAACCAFVSVPAEGAEAEQSDAGRHSAAQSAETTPVFDWAGLYIGVNLGAGLPLHGGERLQAGSGLGSPAFGLYPASFARTGVAVRAQAGYNWQNGPWVWGFETDISLLDGRRGPTGAYVASPVYPGPAIFTLAPNSSANFFAAIRGRAGVAFDRALIYLTGGVAAGGARGPATLTIGGAPFITPWSQSSRMKYAVGAGLEYAFADDWSARAEYLFLSRSLNTQLFDDGAGSTYFSRVRNENHILRFGLNYRFGARNRIPGAIQYGESRNGHNDNGSKEEGREEQYSIHARDFPPSYDTVRRRSVKTGGGVNIKQQLMPNLGFFLRASMTDGRYETVDYTDVDRQLSMGLVAAGALWGRDDDEIGVAGALSGLHGDRVRYFALGGTSVYIGDGALSYAGEKNMEAYYKLGFGKDMDATFDYQLLVNPAHNAARGPVNVFGLRLRAAF
jgi:opacity protein-like surface antigen